MTDALLALAFVLRDQPTTFNDKKTALALAKVSLTAEAMSKTRGPDAKRA
jgi:hypothetical protein